MYKVKLKESFGFGMKESRAKKASGIVPLRADKVPRVQQILSVRSIALYFLFLSIGFE